MKSSHSALLLAAAAVVGYLVYRKWQDVQRAATHPLVIASDASLLKQVTVNPSLVSDAQLL